MKLETAKRIVNASDGALELREDYSGRNMCGPRTTGIVGNLKDLLQGVALVVNQMDNHGVFQFEDFLDDLDVRTDNMGMSTIYY